jgi:hypothetical protein
VRIARILDLGQHSIEFLADGSVDIVDTATLGEREYTHLDPEEAYLLFTALFERYKQS